jgi:hypothetical protein
MLIVPDMFAEMANKSILPNIKLENISCTSGSWWQPPFIINFDSLIICLMSMSVAVLLSSVALIQR